MYLCEIQGGSGFSFNNYFVHKLYALSSKLKVNTGALHMPQLPQLRAHSQWNDSSLYCSVPIATMLCTLKVDPYYFTSFTPYYNLIAGRMMVSYHVEHAYNFKVNALTISQ